MKTIQDIRKAVKPLGFKLKTRSLSWGLHATWADGEGNTCPSIFSPETLAKWQPLLDFRRENGDALRALKIPGLAL